MTDLDWEKLWQEPPTAPPQPPHHANGRRPPAPGIGVASVSNADRWVDAAVAGIEAELRDSGTWPQGYSDSYGRGWDKLQADAAMRLGAIAKADWNRFSFDEAHARFIAAAPTGGGWSGRDVEYKWRYHSARATPAPAPSGVTDPRPAVGIVDPLELLAPPPANGIWEAAVAATDAPPSDEQAERPRTSWWPSPIAERAAEAEEAPTPTHLLRDDGEALFYSGKVNGLIGESESGKSWVALLAVQQATADGERCLVLDFEDSPASVKRRLDALQLDPAQLGLVDYADPQEALGALQSADLQEAIGQHYRIILADGVNVAMTLMGYDLNSNTDATEFSTRLLRPMARTGACVITVDHVPKNPETRGKGGIGAQQKRALQDGTCLLVEVLEPFGKGQTGELRLTVDKDRNGHVRGIAAGGKHAGKVRLESDGETVQLTITAPDLRPREDRPAWQPTVVMEKVSRLLERASQPMSRTEIAEAAGGRRQVVWQAVGELVAGGYITPARRPGRGGGEVYNSVKPFRETAAGTSSQPVPGTGSELVPGPVPPYGDRNKFDQTADQKSTKPVPEQVRGPAGDDWSACNHCGDATPDRVLDDTAGYCLDCARLYGGGK
jgi:KaiC/GvpD/RAD55 family RecA-like ATPase